MIFSSLSLVTLFGVPILALSLDDVHKPRIEQSGQFGLYLLGLNTGTALFCLFPILLLSVVLIHRLMWPILARLLFPLRRFKIILNTPVLLSVGVLCLTFAFKIRVVTV